MAACRYTCDGCNRAVPRAMWEDDQYWTTDSSEFYCHGCWVEWTAKQGSLVPGMGASAGDMESSATGRKSVSLAL